MLGRIAAIAAALLLCLGAARAAGSLCVVAPGVTALIDPSGAEWIPNGSCDALFAVREGSLYAAGSRGDYRLFSAEGQPLGDISFGMIYDAGDALIYRSGERYGAMDADGAALIEARWSQLAPDGAGGWLALEGDPLDDAADEILRLDAAGEAEGTGVYTTSGLAKPSEGRMPYRAENGLWGAIDAAAGIAVECVWRSLGGFQNGLAKAGGAQGLGLIDGYGQIVVSPVYRWLERGEGFIAGITDRSLDIYSADGRELRFSLPEEGLEAGIVGDRLWVCDGASTRLYDPSGELLMKGPAELTFAPGTGGQLIAMDGQWGEACQWLADPDGSAASGRWQQLLPLCPGRYACMRMQGTEYYSDLLGGIQTSWNYDTVRYGVIDAAGGVVLDAHYREVRYLGGERLLLVSRGMAQLADLDGNIVKTWITGPVEAPTGEAGS